MAEVEERLEARVGHEIDIRHRLAELGYGPLERPKLTHIEQRELIEGSLRAEQRDLEKEVKLRGGDPKKAESEQQANDEMVSDLQAKINEVKGRSAADQ